MPPYTIEQIRNEVSRASEEYNATAPLGEKIASVSLFGSYADGRATRRSDIDLLVRFTSAVVSLFTLARSSLTFRLQRSDGSEVEKLHTAWTQKGRKFLYHTLKRRGVLPLAEQGG